MARRPDRARRAHRGVPGHDAGHHGRPAVLRGPVQVAKTLAAIDILSDGAWSPGSARVLGGRLRRRRPRVPGALSPLRRGTAGCFVSSCMVRWRVRGPVLLHPRCAAPTAAGAAARPAIWVASWARRWAAAGARPGEGWLASAYNTRPDRFRDGLDRLAQELRRSAGRRRQFPSAIATTWLYVTEDKGAAERTLSDVLAPI